MSETKESTSEVNSFIGVTTPKVEEDIQTPLELVHELQEIETDTISIKTRIIKVLIKIKNFILCSSSCLKTSTKTTAPHVDKT